MNLFRTDISFLLIIYQINFLSLHDIYITIGIANKYIKKIFGVEKCLHFLNFQTKENNIFNIKISKVY